MSKTNVAVIGSMWSHPYFGEVDIKISDNINIFANSNCRFTITKPHLNVITYSDEDWVVLS